MSYASLVQRLLNEHMRKNSEPEMSGLFVYRLSKFRSKKQTKG